MKLRFPKVGLLELAFKGTLNLAEGMGGGHGNLGNTSCGGGAAPAFGAAPLVGGGSPEGDTGAGGGGSAEPGYGVGSAGFRAESGACLVESAAAGSFWADWFEA